jgi:hypothetical protein
MLFFGKCSNLVFLKKQTFIMFIDKQFVTALIYLENTHTKFFFMHENNPLLRDINNRKKIKTETI